MSDRACHIEHFYELLKQLENRVGGKRQLSTCNWNMGWPNRGVYFFFENGEYRSTSDSELRVVRVGTHAVNANSKSRLWNRLYEHKQDGGRSVFRNHVNAALKSRSERNQDHNHSRCISNYVGDMPFLWINVDGKDGHLKRRKIESNAIALLSHRTRGVVDKPSKRWLGHSSDNASIKRSGLWNVQHTKSKYDPRFLDLLKNCVNETGKLTELDSDWDSPACLSDINGPRS